MSARFFYARTMYELVKVEDAANRLHLSKEMVYYWVRVGRVQKHYPPNFTKQYFVDFQEVVKATAGLFAPNEIQKVEHLVTPKSAALQNGVDENIIKDLADRGYLFKFYVFGNMRDYLVDEVETQNHFSTSSQKI